MSTAKTKTYNYLIVGSGVEALLTALHLQSLGQRGALIEKEDQLGGSYRPWKFQEQLFDAHLFLWPNREETLRALQLVQKHIPDLLWESYEVGPITYQNGQVQPFMGFGETSLPAADQYSAFTEARQLRLNKSLAEIIETLSGLYQGEVLTQSHVTQLTLTAEETSLTVNGAQKLAAEKIYFFENPQWLSKLLQNEDSLVNKSTVQKLSKSNLWTAVNLMFVHTETLNESPSVHVLYGAKEQACVGRFSEQNGKVTSQWLCFLNEETAMDSEALGAALREMKRQIKRQYPRFLEAVEKDFISVSKNTYGSVPSNLLDKATFPKVPQLILGSRFYQSQNGLLGDLESALGLCQSSTPSNFEAETVSQSL